MALQLLTKQLGCLAIKDVMKTSCFAMQVATYKKVKTPTKYDFPKYHRPVKIDYTKPQMNPIKRPRLSGCDELGHRVSRRGGGNKKNYRVIDLWRAKPEDDFDKPLIEKVINIVYDPNRSASLAVLAAGERKRYVLATQHMKVGDIVKTTTKIPRIAVKPEEGDSHKIGALPIGTLVNSVQRFPGDGSRVARAAGTAAVLIRKVDGRCIVKLPSKREMNISEDCMATVGRVGNVEHNKFKLGKAGRNRWRGIKPRSGWWNRKDGRFGRKIKGPKPIKIYDVPEPEPEEVMQLDLRMKKGCGEWTLPYEIY